MSGPSNPRHLRAVGWWETIDAARALEAARAALREVMEDHAWKDELWRFTDETEAVLAALEAPQ